jgi:hypothetical protein
MTPPRSVLTILLLMIVAGATACRAPQSTQQNMGEIQPQLLQYVTQQGWQRDNIARIEFDEFNSAWQGFWEGIEMTPEAARWHERLHEVWFYQLVLRAEEREQRMLWVVVQRSDRKPVALLTVR